MATVVKSAAHMLLFLLAGLVFFLGLGIGLQLNPIVGTALWAVAGAIAALNLLWIYQRGS